MIYFSVFLVDAYDKTFFTNNFQHGVWYSVSCAVNTTIDYSPTELPVWQVRSFDDKQVINVCQCQQSNYEIHFTWCILPSSFSISGQAITIQEMYLTATLTLLSPHEFSPWYVNKCQPILRTLHRCSLAIKTGKYLWKITYSWYIFRQFKFIRDMKFLGVTDFFFSL